jgi:hypothetical protein
MERLKEPEVLKPWGDYNEFRQELEEEICLWKKARSIPPASQKFERKMEIFSIKNSQK